LPRAEVRVDPCQFLATPHKRLVGLPEIVHNPNRRFAQPWIWISNVRLRGDPAAEHLRQVRTRKALPNGLPSLF
jgi:hypothetical protein